MKFIKYLAFTFFFFLMALLALPTIFSTNIAKPYLLSLTSHFLSGSIDSSEVELSWFGGAKLKNVVIKDAEGSTIAEISSATIDTPLYTLPFYKSIHATVDIDASFIKLTDENSLLTIDTLLHKTPLKTDVKNLSFEDLQLNIDCNLPNKCQITLKAKESSSSGNINLHLFTENLQAKRPDIAGTIDLQRFPTALIDIAVSKADPKYRDITPLALGSTITSSIELQKDAATFSLQSSTLNAKGSLGLTDAGITVRDSTTVSYTVTTDLVKKLAGLITCLPSDLTLKKPVTVTATLNKDLHGSMRLNKAVILSSKELPSSLTTTFESTFSLLPFEAKANLSSSLNNERVSLDLHANGEDITNLEKRNITVNMNLDAEASIIGAIYTDLNGSLDDILGKKLVMKLNSHTLGKKTVGNWELSSKTLQSQGAFEHTNFTSLLPSTFSMQIGQKALSKHVPKDYTIESPLGISASFSAANVSDKEIDLHMTIEPLTIRHDKKVLHIKKTDAIMQRKKEMPARVVITTAADLDAPTAYSGDLLIDLDALALFSNKISGSISSKASTLHHLNEPLGTYSFSIPFSHNKKTNEFLLDIDIDKEKEKVCKAKLDLKKSDTALPWAITTKGSLHSFDTHIISVISGIDEIPILLGNKIEGTFQGHFDPSFTNNEPITVSLSGDEFAIQTFASVGKEISGAKAVDISWKMTNDRFQALQRLFQTNYQDKKRMLVLDKPVGLHFTLSNLKVDLEPILQGKKKVKIGSFIDQTSFDFSLNRSAVYCTLFEKEKPKKKTEVSVTKSDAKGSFKGMQRELLFSIKSDQKKEMASVNGSFFAKHAFSRKGIDFDSIETHFDAELHEIPLDLFEAVTDAERLLDIFGNTLDISIKGDLKKLKTGSFSGSIETPKFKSKIQSRLEDGKLLLDEDMTATYLLTKEAGSAILKDINPLLVTAASANEPIGLNVEKNGFSIPIRSFSLKKVMVPSITITPGKLTAKNGGVLSLLLTVLKIDEKKKDTVSLWFTPIYLSIEKGVVNCKRSDILVDDKYPIATWGSIDLVNDRVNMTLGLAEKTVKKAFGVKNLDPSFMLQIPITGKTSSPNFDTKWATARITALKLQQKTLNTTAIIGGLVEIATAVKEKKPPEPTTVPFPWEAKE